MLGVAVRGFLGKLSPKIKSGCLVEFLPKVEGGAILCPLLHVDLVFLDKAIELPWLFLVAGSAALCRAPITTLAQRSEPPQN